MHDLYPSTIPPLLQALKYM